MSQEPKTPAPDSASDTSADAGGVTGGNAGADTPGTHEPGAPDSAQAIDWKARFEHATSERDQLREQFRQLKDADSGLKAKLADALGVAPVSDSDDPKVLIKQLQDQVKAESQRRTDLEKRLAREHVLAGAADPTRARVILAGLEATGELTLDPTDATAVAAARSKLEADFPELFTKPAGQKPKPSPSIAAPRSRNNDALAEIPSSFMVGGRRRM